MEPEDEEVYLSIAFYKITRANAAALIDHIQLAINVIPRSALGEMHIHIGEPFEDEDE